MYMTLYQKRKLRPYQVWGYGKEGEEEAGWSGKVWLKNILCFVGSSWILVEGFPVSLPILSLFLGPPPTIAVEHKVSALHSKETISSVQSLIHVQLLAAPWTAACQASLSITSFWSLLKLMSIESVMPSNHLILCHPLLLLPSIFPRIWVFSIESVFCIGWPKYWRFSFSISPSNE